MKSNSGEIKRGQTISFRVPSDTPDHLLKHLQQLKERERRNFSRKIADFVIQGLGNAYSRERETITIPLPRSLSKSQRDWLKHEHSEALLGSIIFHLLSDPVRATALLASLNSNALDIDEALYLQEELIDKEMVSQTIEEESDSKADHEEQVAATLDTIDDDLDDFDWEKAKQNESQEIEEESDEVETDLDDLLGDFLSKMNK